MAALLHLQPASRPLPQRQMLEQKRHEVEVQELSRQKEQLLHTEAKFDDINSKSSHQCKTHSKHPQRLRFHQSIRNYFSGHSSSAAPASLRDIALGLVELAYPESRPAVRGGDYSAAVGRVGLAQFYVNLSVEFMPLYQPNQQEVKDPKLFANNVRQVMADRLGVPTTNSFYNYLKMEKCKNMIK